MFTWNLGVALWFFAFLSSSLYVILWQVWFLLPVHMWNICTSPSLGTASLSRSALLNLLTSNCGGLLQSYFMHHLLFIALHLFFRYLRWWQTVHPMIRQKINHPRVCGFTTPFFQFRAWWLTGVGLIQVGLSSAWVQAVWWAHVYPCLIHTPSCSWQWTVQSQKINMGNPSVSSPKPLLAPWLLESPWLK